MSPLALCQYSGRNLLDCQILEGIGFATKCGAADEKATVFLRALVSIDPYAFDDVAEQLAANDENNQQTSEEILLSTIDGLPDDKLTGFALRLVLTAHTPIPRESEIDLLSEAEAAFAPPRPKKTASKKTMIPAPIKAAQKTAAKKTTAKKDVAA
jgi:ParB family chromosome partitioning protein